MKILAADDEADVRLLLEVALGMSPDIELTLAASGAEALEIANTWTFDLFVLDGLMPGLDGAFTCRQLKSDPRHAGVRVVFLTALAEDQRVALREAGADAFVTKPFDPFTLADTLRALV